MNEAAGRGELRRATEKERFLRVRENQKEKGRGI